MVQVDTPSNTTSYLGEGDVRREKIKKSLQIYESVIVWGHSKNLTIREDYSFNELIYTSLEGLDRTMVWRKRRPFSMKFDPIRAVLGYRVSDFYRVFDELRKQKIIVIATGPNTIQPFMYFVDAMNFVAAFVDPNSHTIFYSHGLLETWRGDPRILQFDGKGVTSFQTLFSLSLVNLITSYLGMGLVASRKVQDIFDLKGILKTNLSELVEQTECKTWPGTKEAQRKAEISLRGYLNAWFDFMAKSGWLEIHHTLQDSKVAEKEQSFLDTATTEINETAQEIIVDYSQEDVIDNVEKKRAEKKRGEKQMQWTMMRIALGILYPRKKNFLRSCWENKERGITWNQLEERYYEEIWDLIRLDLAGKDIVAEIEEKDMYTLGKMHFIFELKRSERPREKIRTLEQFTIEELRGRKENLLTRLKWEGKVLSSDAAWVDIVTRFRKLIIRYHPDRVEVTGIEPVEAKKVSSQVIQDFRELEIIHDLHPEIFK